MKSIKTRLLITILIPLFLVLGTNTAFITNYVIKIVRTESQQYVQSLAREKSEVIKGELEGAYHVVKTLAASIEGFEHYPDDHRREIILEQASLTLKNFPEINSLSIAFEPNALDAIDEELANTEGSNAEGRFVPYISRQGGRVTINTLSDVEQGADWYRIARDTQQEKLLDPMPQNIEGTEVWMVSVVVPIIHEGEFVGAAAVAMSLSSVQDLVNEVRIYDSGYTCLASHSGTLVAHPNAEVIGGNVIELTQADNRSIVEEAITIGKEATYREKSLVTGIETIRYFVPIQVGEDEAPWSFIVVVPEKEVFVAVSKLNLMMLIGGFVACVVMGLITLYLSNLITKPVRQAAEDCRRIAEGDFSHLKDESRLGQDEVGQLVRSFNQINRSMQKMIGDVINASVEMSASSQELSATSEEISAQTQTATVTTEGLAATAEETGAAAEEVSASSQEVLDNTRRLAKRAEEGRLAAQRIKKRADELKVIIEQSVAETSNLYKQRQGEIEQALKEAEVVEEISGMAEDIAAIAGQTNLLALNAAIEAARAGEHGRGFAVVAKEISTLADQSAQTVKEIQSTITQVQKAFNNLASDAETVLNFIDEKVMQDYDLLVDTIKSYDADADYFHHLTQEFAENAQYTLASMDEISRAMEAVTKGAEGAADDSQEVAMGMAEMARAVEEVARVAQVQARMADELNQMVQQFKV